MKFKLFLIIYFFWIFGCGENPKHTFYNLINDNFLKILDTTAYKTGRLIQIPNNILNDKNLNKVCVIIDTNFYNNKELNKSMLILTREEGLKEFEELIINDIEFNFGFIDISNINKTGNFFLVKSEMVKENSCSALAGKITFFKPYIAKDKAIIIFSISEPPKSGYTNCWLFKKYKGKWKKIRNFEIERW